MEQAMMGAGGGGKKQREVYVGNLTIGSVNDVMLRELFNGALAHLMPDAATNPPVVNVAMDPSGAFILCSCPPLCIAAIWEYMWGGKHCSAAGTSELDMVRLSVVSPLEEACMQVLWLACRALRLCGDAGRRSSPPAPWPWTRWICAADPSTSGDPRDMWSRLRWGSRSPALISPLGKMLCGGSADVWALSGAPEIHWPRRWHAHA